MTSCEVPCFFAAAPIAAHHVGAAHENVAALVHVAGLTVGIFDLNFAVFDRGSSRSLGNEAISQSGGDCGGAGFSGTIDLADRNATGVPRFDLFQRDQRRTDDHMGE